MKNRVEILKSLKNAISEEGFGVSCEEAKVFEDEEGRKRNCF
jgi:hypothetical protein